MSGAAEAEALLRRVAGMPDGDIDVAETALALARLDRPQIALGRYRSHLEALVRDVRDEAALNPAGDPAARLSVRIGALNSVLLDRHGYRGDAETYDELDNANLMSVIDRRRGLPVALGILYIHAGRAQGWTIEGLAFPGHFLVRLEADRARAIVDPFHAGRVRDTEGLRELLKATAGAAAELQPAHYATVGNRDILLRLHNNVKTRLLRADRIEPAAEAIRRMLLFAPAEAGLWRESGLCHARLGNLAAAIAALETFIGMDAGQLQRHQAARLLQELKARLN